ncbi:MAG: thiamine diphosphokinase [Bacilli bacterium]
MQNKLCTLILPLTNQTDLPLLKGDLIGVDGGCAFALAHHLPLVQALGDFDSLSQVAMATLQAKRIPIKRFPVQKDQSDGELAINWALDQGYQSIDIVGFTGGRLDHYQVMLQTLFRTKRSTIRLISSLQTIQWLGSGTHEIKSSRGETYFSLFTFIQAIVSLNQCLYPMLQQKLTVNDTFTLSNEWQNQKPATLTIHAGEVLLFTSFR